MISPVIAKYTQLFLPVFAQSMFSFLNPAKTLFFMTFFFQIPTPFPLSSRDAYYLHTSYVTHIFRWIYLNVTLYYCLRSNYYRQLFIIHKLHTFYASSKKAVYQIIPFQQLDNGLNIQLINIGHYMCVEWRKREGGKKLIYFLSQWQSSISYLQKGTIIEIHFCLVFINRVRSSNNP